MKKPKPVKPKESHHVVGPLGRRRSPDTKHIEKYPFRVVRAVANVENILPLPSWHEEHDQGTEGACVGYGWSMAKAILDKQRFNDAWLWNEAKKIDIWPDTNPGDNNGTSVRAAGDVLRDQGHVLKGKRSPERRWAIQENRWATTVDEMRTAIAGNVPVVIGVNWYSNFDNPQHKGTEHWIGEGSLGHIRGGHCVCIIGASDKRQAFLAKNSWGKNYPLVWIPYTTMQRLLNEDGEAALITDEVEVDFVGYIFTKQLKIGSRNKDVLALQRWLNNHGYTVASEGAGSPGNETNYFGALTRTQVRKLQLDRGIAKQTDAGFGQVGPKTREYLNKTK